MRKRIGMDVAIQQLINQGHVKQSQVTGIGSWNLGELLEDAYKLEIAFWNGTHIEYQFAHLSDDPFHGLSEDIPS